jgi:hypothetical protein
MVEVEVSRNDSLETVRKEVQWAEVFNELKSRFTNASALRKELRIDTTRDGLNVFVNGMPFKEGDGVQQLQMVFQGDTLYHLQAVYTQTDLLGTSKAEYRFEYGNELVIRRGQSTHIGAPNTYSVRYLLR